MILPGDSESSETKCRYSPPPEFITIMILPGDSESSETKCRYSPPPEYINSAKLLPFGKKILDETNHSATDKCTATRPLANIGVVRLLREKRRMTEMHAVEVLRGREIRPSVTFLPAPHVADQTPAP
ncbi:hypothetical protein QE152_g15444 [Popillia japonica]|uniref:Uncharacterized protein n=1 Tax=Popillia japonica TaxID=7064 RepID=A0AAW1L5S7_POPJA